MSNGTLPQYIAYTRTEDASQVTIICTDLTLTQALKASSIRFYPLHIAVCRQMTAVYTLANITSDNLLFSLGN